MTKDAYDYLLMSTILDVYTILLYISRKHVVPKLAA